MIAGSRFEGLATTLEGWWSRRGPSVMRGVVPLLACVAAIKLSGEFRRLVFDTGPLGAIDLLSRLMEVQLTFAGTLVYGKFGAAIYPPASYALLWPFTGWLGPEPARWLWAATFSR